MATGVEGDLDTTGIESRRRRLVLTLLVLLLLGAVLLLRCARGEPLVPLTPFHRRSTELHVVVPEDLRIPPPTRGPAIGKTRRVVLQNLEVDVRVETADLGATLPGAYAYQPRL